MITIESSMYVPGMRAARVIEFMLHPADDRYRTWWPGTHLAMHALNDTDGGANITHTIRAGYSGPVGRILDPLLRVYFSARFAKMMHEHFAVEFSALPGIVD